MGFKFNPITATLDIDTDTAVTLTDIGSSPNASGASLSGQALTLQPASASFGGVVTTGAQTFAGAKSFSSLGNYGICYAETPDKTLSTDEAFLTWNSSLRSMHIGTSGGFNNRLVVYHASGETNSQVLVRHTDSGEASLCFSNTVRPYTMGVNSSGRFIIAYYPSSLTTGELVSLTYTGDLGIGLGNADAAARLEVRSTTEQFRLSYDGSNRMTATVSSAGVVTFDAVGSSSSFAFSDRMGVGSGALALSGKLVAVGDTNTNTADTDNIIVGYAQNLTQGFAMRYNGLYATGSNANVALYLVAKSSNIFFNGGLFYIEGDSYSHHNGVRIGGGDATNTIYANNGMRLSVTGGTYGLGLLTGGTIQQTGLNATDGAAEYTFYINDQKFASGCGGGIAFGGHYQTGVPGVFATMQGFKENGTSGNFAGAWRVYTRINGGALTERFRIASTGDATFYQGLTVTGDLTLSASDIITDTSTGMKIGTSTSQKIGFWNATPVVQQTDGAGLTNDVTVGGTDNVIADFDGDPGGVSDPMDAADRNGTTTQIRAARDDIYQLARKVKIINDALRAYGLLS